jgi:CRISPR-associated protein Cmr1
VGWQNRTIEIGGRKMKTRNPKKVFPDTSVPEITPKPDDRITEVRRYKLITPLFGGGVEAQKADPITIIRGASVRGQLRFWWRATRGGQFGSDLNKMRTRENAIWGSAVKKDKENSGPSKVCLAIKILKEGKPFLAVDNRGKHVTNIGDPKSVYSYVAFPLRDLQGAKVLQDVEFELTISYPRELEADVSAALWAWETFGGIGARTRRGFGALLLTHTNGNGIQLPSSAHLQENIANSFKQHVTTGKGYRGVARLMPNQVHVVPKSKNDDSIRTWQYMFEKMKQFRQFRYDKNGRPFGRSKWPEPDTIRRLTGNQSRGHEPKHPVVGKFPRAQFGLPIIFKFKDDDEKTGDPFESKLEPRDSERWASPLILRPVACSDGYIGLAIRLASSLKDIDGGIVLKDASNRVHPTEWQIDGNEATQIEPLDGEPDVIEAFLKYLKQ